MKDPTRFRHGAVVHAVKLCTRGRTWLYAPCGAQSSVHAANEERRDGRLKGGVDCPVCLVWMEERR